MRTRALLEKISSSIRDYGYAELFSLANSFMDLRDVDHSVLMGNFSVGKRLTYVMGDDSIGFRGTASLDPGWNPYGSFVVVDKKS